jgi:hypothetical protein
MFNYREHGNDHLSSILKADRKTSFTLIKQTERKLPVCEHVSSWDDGGGDNVIQVSQRNNKR